MNVRARLFAACVIALGMNTYAHAQAAGDVQTVMCDDLLPHMHDNIVVDVRAEVDYAKTHIAGAVNLPYYSFANAAWPKDANIVLYCSGIGCSLSHDSALILTKMGYAHVRTLYGGLAEWQRKALPVVSAPAPVVKPDPLAGRSGLVFTTPEVGGKDVAAQLKGGAKLTVLDVRPAREYAAGHIAGARNVPLEQLAQHLGDYAKGAEVVVCDRVADRAAQARGELADAGIPAHVLTGGISVWAASGRPLAVGADVR